MNKKRRITQSAIILWLQNEWNVGVSFFFQVLLSVFYRHHIYRPIRTCRRLPRIQGWWNMIWHNSNDKRFKLNFRVTKATFLYILDQIHDLLAKETICEDPIPPNIRLAVCLYRLGRGDYLHTIGELVGLGTSTVCSIVKETCEAIVLKLWLPFVDKNMPKTVEELIEIMDSFEETWQFPCAFGAVDGCHLPIKCPTGGLESAKEFHNFKNFYSVVLMAVVDSKKRFMWASSGFPGNSHDSIILQSTTFFQKMSNGNYLPPYCAKDKEVNLCPCLLGDSAFPFLPWLLKPYSGAILSKEERYFNYRLSRARMVVEGAFGLLKGRWRVLLRKSECQIETVKSMSLASIVLHNICIDLEDKPLKVWDLAFDESCNKERPRETIRDILHMTSSTYNPKSSHKATLKRNYLKDRFWSEQLTQHEYQF